MAWQPRWSRYRVPSFSPFKRYRTIWAEYVPDAPPPPPLTDAQKAQEEITAFLFVIAVVTCVIGFLALLAIADHFGLASHFIGLCIIAFPLGCFYFVFKRYQYLKKVAFKDK